MQVTNIHQAKSHLSKLVELVFEGEEVIRDMQPRTPGYWKGKLRISEDFDELPEHIAAAFRGAYSCHS